MADDSDFKVRAELVRLHGRMAAFSEAMHILGEETARIARAARDDTEDIALAGVDAVRGSASRIGALFQDANAEFEQIKLRLDPADSALRH